jgi:hypothetical protein
VIAELDQPLLTGGGKPAVACWLSACRRKAASVEDAGSLNVAVGELGAPARHRGGEGVGHVGAGGTEGWYYGDWLAHEIYPPAWSGGRIREARRRIGRASGLILNTK